MKKRILANDPSYIPEQTKQLKHIELRLEKEKNPEKRKKLQSERSARLKRVKTLEHIKSLESSVAQVKKELDRIIAEINLPGATLESIKIVANRINKREQKS